MFKSKSPPTDSFVESVSLTRNGFGNILREGKNGSKRARVDQRYWNVARLLRFGKQGPSIFLIHKTTKLQHEPLSPSRLATLLQLSTKRNNIKIHPCSILIARNHLSPHIISFGARTAIEIKIEAAARSILPCSPMPFTNDHYSRGDSFMFKPIKVSSSGIVPTQEIRYRFLRPP